jgi:hypothetical protein
MSKRPHSSKRHAVRLLDHAIKTYKKAESSNSYKPSTDTSVATFERYVKRLEVLANDPGSTVQFWALHQKVYIKLLKQTLKLRN